MRKSIIALIATLFMLVNSAGVLVLAEGASAEALALAEVIAKDVYTKAANVGGQILENDKYIFVVEGERVFATSNPAIRINDSIHIYEKPNSEHLDYEYITSISKTSNNAARNAPARSVILYDDVLYVTWGNVVYQKNTNAFYPNGTTAAVSYAEAFDVSEVKAGETIPSKIITTSIEQRVTTHAPYIRGGIAYFDEENEYVYISGVSNSKYGKREILRYDHNDIKSALDGEITSVPVTEVETPGNSTNTVQFAIKDGFLYQVLQQRAGLVDFDMVDATLKDGEGNAMNNTVVIFDADNGYLNVGSSNLSNNTYITEYQRGKYTTATAGGAVIYDIDVCGNYMYLATTNGLEVVDVTAAKTQSSLCELSLEERLLEGVVVNGITVNGNELYVGTDSQMLIYDISNGVPSLLYSFDYAGGFNDFKINEEENMLYALSATKKGGAVLIDLDLLVGGLVTENFAFTSDGEATEEICEGKLGYSADITNNTAKETSFSALFAITKDGKLADVSVKEYNLSSGDTVNVSDEIEIASADGLSASVILVDDIENANIIPMITSNGFEFEKEIGAEAKVGKESENSIEIDDMNVSGDVLIGGSLASYKNNPVLIMAKNLSSDRMSGLRFIDVVSLDENGKYNSAIKPQDSGEYEITIKKAIGGGNASKIIDVPDINVTAENTVEVPGIDSYVYLEFEYGQNIETLNIEISFDENVVEFGDELKACDDFDVKNVSVQNGILKATFTKKADRILTTEANEFCTLPIKISDDADYGNYDIAINVDAFDEFSNEITAVSNDGVLEIVESTPKYEALDDAKKALSSLKDASKLEVNDYITEKEKVEDAREKVEKAYEYFIRDSQMGTELIKNLQEAEAKMEEFVPYYDALAVVNGETEDNVYSKIKENNKYFGLEETALEVYENLEDKSEVDKILSETEFQKPSDIKGVFYETVVLETFPTVNWQNVRTLLTLGKETGKINLDKYNNLTDKQKAAADKELDLREYDDFDELQDALDDAVAYAKKSVTTSQSGSGGSGSSGSSKGNANKEYYVSPKEPTVVPTNAPVEDKKEIFEDIEDYDWAKEAILYLYENKVLNGKAQNIFAPSDNVTREEFAKMVSVAFDIKDAKADKEFKDVDNNAWYSEYIYALSNANIINGREDGTFGVGDDITREEIAVILERIANLKEIELENDSEKVFADSEEISSYAKDAINKMCASGIISGYPDGTVKPKDCATRAQAAQLIFKLVSLY